MNNSAIVIDTPEGIEAYRLLAIKGALTLETKGLRSRFRPADLARAVLEKAGKPAPKNKVKLLEAYTAHLREIGVLVTPEPKKT